jgi:two-component system, response regulator / RNA-binding antiterminator
MTSAVPVETKRVLLVTRTEERARVLQRALATGGHCVVGESASARGLHHDVVRLDADLVIVDVESADEATLAHLGMLSEQAPRPVVVFTDDPDRMRIRDAVRCGVTSYVVDGFAQERIEPIVRVAMARFERERHIQAERDQAKAKLAERKLIERAKGILMRKRGIGEDEAYHALRRIAMDRNLPMREVAKRLIAMSDLLG